MKERVLYYKDELNDDFGNIEFNNVVVPDNFNYKRNWWRVFADGFLYWVIIHPILSLACIFNHTHIKGHKNLNEYYKLTKKSKSGGFIYGNHVSNQDAYQLQAYVIWRRRVNIIGLANTLSVPFLRGLVKALGYIPLATTLRGQANMMKALEYYIKDKKEDVLIYPEAHIWPYYTKVRPFVSASFHYPAKFNVPVLPFVTVFKKRLIGKKPKRIIMILPPVAPDPSKDIKENKEYLRDYCYNLMKETAEKESTYEYIKYIKKED